MSERGTTNEVRLSVPSSTQFLRVARLTAASAVSSCGFDIEEIEDLRIAVGEAMTLLIESGGEVVELVLCLSSGEVVVAGRTRARRQPVVDAISAQILAATVSDFRCWALDDTVRFEFVLRAGAGGDGDAE